MANKKITELNEATSISNNDWLVMVDVANDETKKIHAGEVGGNIPIQDTAPQSPEENDLWIDTSENVRFKYYDGTSWVYINDIVLNARSNSQAVTYSCDYENKHFGGVELYNDSTGSAGEITLSDDIDNYSRIKIFYTSSSVEGFYEFIPKSTAIKIGIGCIYKTGSLFIQTIGTYSCNEDKLTPQLAECGYLSTSSSGSSMHWDNTNYCSIKKVIGYK